MQTVNTQYWISGLFAKSAVNLVALRTHYQSGDQNRRVGLITLRTAMHLKEFLLRPIPLVGGAREMKSLLSLCMAWGRFHVAKIAVSCSTRELLQY